MRKLFKKIGCSQKSDLEAGLPPPSPPKRNLALHIIHTDANHTLNYPWPRWPLYDIMDPSRLRHFLTEDMLPKVFAECDISIRVLSLEYSKEDEDDLGAEGIAAFLVDETKKLDGHGVLWIAHSFGGPLLRGVLSTDQNLVEVTKGVLFFGVPRDVATGSWGNMSITTTGIEVGLSDEMRRLQKEVRWLAETERAFGVFCVNGKLAPGWFVESSGGLEDTSHRESKRRDIIHLGETHGEMVRFGGSSDEDWKRVEQVLMDMAKVIVKQTMY